MLKFFLATFVSVAVGLVFVQVWPGQRDIEDYKKVKIKLNQEPLTV